MELDNVGDSVAVHRLFVGEIEVDGDAKVAADDDYGGHCQVEEEHGHDEGEVLKFHLPPGKRAGQAEGLRAVPSPAQNGEHGPHQAVEPNPHAQDLHCLPTDFLIC